MEFLNDLQNFYSNIEKIAEVLASSIKNQNLPIDSGWYKVMERHRMGWN